MEAERESSSSSDDEGADEKMNDGEGESETQLDDLEQQVAAAPQSYEAHVALVTALRASGELERLRAARQRFAQYFPLSPQLWLQWLRDEIGVAEGEEGSQLVGALFQRAVADYVSVDVWVEFVQWAIGAKTTAEARDVFERAVAAVGLHARTGVIVWEAYLCFEKLLLTALDDSSENAHSSDEQKAAAAAQRSRLASLYRRCMSVPLDDAESLWNEYCEFRDGAPADDVRKLYEAAQTKWSQLRPFEEAVEQAADSTLGAFYSYIAFERTSKEPTRIQCVFERAVTEHCLDAKLWLRYLKWLDSDLKIGSVCLAAYQRAVRNCYWSAGIWSRYLLALESDGADAADVDAVFEQAVGSCTRASPDDGRHLWLTFAYLLRRRLARQAADGLPVDFGSVRQVFERGAEALAELYGTRHWDADGGYRRAWAFFEAAKCANVDKARHIWQSLLGSGCAKYSDCWLDYIRLERQFGTIENCRRLFYKAVNSASDYPEVVQHAFLQFEQEEGSLDELKTARQRIEAQWDRIAASRPEKAADRKRKSLVTVKEEGAAETAKGEPFAKVQRRGGGASRNADEDSPSKRSGEKAGGAARKPAQRIPEVKPAAGENSVNAVSGPAANSSAASADTDGEGFRVPSLPTRARPTQPEDTAAAAVAEGSSSAEYHVDTSRYDRTVFVSNLQFDVNQSDLSEIFSSIGELSEVRLIMRGGRSRGYGYVEFNTCDPVQAALEMDRTPVHGRPMFVSRCEDKSKKPTEFRFGGGLEKNKLFVRNLSYDVTQSDMQDFFGAYGTLKSVRLVTHRNGKPKGLCYVEFADDASAARAVVATDGKEFAGRVMSVAISNPPPRATGAAAMGASRQSAPLSVGRSAASTAMRPRALRMADASTSRPAASTSESTAGGLSNDQFRAMLSKQ